MIATLRIAIDTGPAQLFGQVGTGKDVVDAHVVIDIRSGIIEIRPAVVCLPNGRLC